MQPERYTQRLIGFVGLDWIAVPGGTFHMGSNAGKSDEGPVHEVAVRGFSMTRSEITVGQYALCVEAGACLTPRTGKSCNWGTEKWTNPMNCIAWDQAMKFAQWAGGRLPTEAEWEYAARGGGNDQPYPWGHEEPTPERAVMCEPEIIENPTLLCEHAQPPTRSICSRPSGNTKQGLCDMAGNVWEWVCDNYHPTYNGADPNGAPYLDGGHVRIVRGGSRLDTGRLLRVTGRKSMPKGSDNPGFHIGFRLVRPMGPLRGPSLCPLPSP